MRNDPVSLHLTYDEAETVAADLARVWPGMTGISDVPAPAQLVELVERTLRKSREIIDGRGMAISASDLPY